MIDLINHHKIPQIDYFACNTLNYPEWTNYYKQLPCIVGASNNETGNIEYGGDWIMESTGENIEFVYFSDIKYKHLLGPTINELWDYSIGYGPAYSVAVMNNTATTTIILYTQMNNYVSITKYSTSSDRSTITASDTFGGCTFAVYTSNYNCPTGTVASPSKDYLFTATNNSSIINMTYNIQNPTINAQIYNGANYTNRTFITTTGNTFGFNRGMAIYQNYLYYSTSTFTIGRVTIVAPTADGVVPTSTVYDNGYVPITELGLTPTTSSSSTYYPTQLTTDTTGNLYIVMGNTDTRPTNSNIIIYNTIDRTKRIINFYSVFSDVKYGYYHSIAWYNNILYIGTYVLTNNGSSTTTWSTSTRGYIIAYYTDQHTTNPNTLQLYAENPNGFPSGLTVYKGSTPSLISSVLLTVKTNVTSRNIFSPMNTLSGFYKPNYNNTTYTLDMDM
jgi:hypothetical protein